MLPLVAVSLFYLTSLSLHSVALSLANHFSAGLLSSPQAKIDLNALTASKRNIRKTGCLCLPLWTLQIVSLRRTDGVDDITAISITRWTVYDMCTVTVASR